VERDRCRRGGFGRRIPDPVQQGILTSGAEQTQKLPKTSVFGSLCVFSPDVERALVASIVTWRL
jgi:hypothetical protein